MRALSGSTATAQVVVPEEACRHGTIWPPRVAEPGHLGRIRPMRQRLHFGDGRREGDVAGRPHIGPAEHHQEVDGRGPRADPRDRLELGVDRVVVELAPDRRGRERPISTAAANARPYLAFWRLNPISRSAASDSSRNRAGVSGSATASSRSNAARADASETCCSRTMWSSVGKPGSLSHSGGCPWRATMPARSGSAAARRSTARSNAIRSSATGTSPARDVTGRPRGSPNRRGRADSASGCGRLGPNPSRRWRSSRPLGGPPRPRSAPAGASRPRHRRRGPRQRAPRRPGSSRAGRTPNIALTLASSACGRVAGTTRPACVSTTVDRAAPLLVGVPRRRVERGAVREKRRHRAHDLGRLVDPAEELVDIDAGRRLERLPAAVDEDEARAGVAEGLGGPRRNDRTEAVPGEDDPRAAASSSREPSATARTSSASVGAS